MICISFHSLIVLLLFANLGHGFIFVRNELIISTSVGDVQGKFENYGDVSYYSYLGIPYAEAPIGPLRFAPPVPKKPWDFIFDATIEGPVCPQKVDTYEQSEMSEDCLNMNVYVPNILRERIPVLAFVHQGDMNRLSNRAEYLYGPQLLMANGVIVISMNYRLGALGFLSVGSEDASGNAGLKDILLSLKWIRENIANFGGDPDNITLGGLSAGSILAHFLMLSEQSTGFFNRVFLNSGSALGYRTLAKYPLDNAINLGKELGYQTDTPAVLLDQLRKADVFHIVEAQGSMGTDDDRNGLRPFSPFVPCVEEQYSHSIITREPLEIIRDGIPQNVPILAGFVADEGIKTERTSRTPFVRDNPALFELIQANFELAIPTNILYPYGSQESENLANSIWNYYFGNKRLSDTSMYDFINLIGDTQFYYAIDSWIELHTSNENSSAVYYYSFDFDGDLNWYKLKHHLDIKGSAHADDLGYLFITNATKNTIESAGSKSKLVMRNMLELWTNFVKYGEPTPIFLEGNSVVWEKIDRGDFRKHLIINDQPRMEYSNPFSERVKFWHDVYEQYEKYLLNGGPIEPKVVVRDHF